MAALTRTCATIAVALALMVVAPALPAGADDPGESDEARVLVL